MQLQQLQEHQSTIAALVGGGKGVARDLPINGGAGGGRASVPSVPNAAGSSAAVRLVQQQQPHLGQSSSDSRLKKRGLDQDSGGGSGTDSAEMIVDVVSSGGPETQTQQQTAAVAESTNSKIARIEPPLSQPTAGHAQHQNTSSLLQQNPQQRITEQPVSQQQPQPVLTMRDAIIFAITYSTDLRSSVKMPYFLTLTPAELDTLAGQDGAGAGHYRGRTRNITSETFVCLNKVRPTALEHQDNCSAYSTGWTPPLAENNGEDDRLVQLFLSAYSFSRPRLDQLSGQYTSAANRESTQLRTTHSSFWTQQQQQKAQPSISEPASPQHSSAVADGAGTSGEEEDEHKQQCQLDENNRRVEAAAAAEQRRVVAAEAELKNAIKMEVDDKENTGTTVASCFSSSVGGIGLSAGSCDIIREEVAGGVRTTVAATPEAARKQQMHKGRFELNRLPLQMPKSASRNEEMEMPQISTTQAMVQVYIRGRGRGRYVCERCGIRCKKPSMLKKHLRSHTNVRPFTCLTCNFAFKTKGNLTKHLVSKAHRRRMLDAGVDEEGGIQEEEEEETIGRKRVVEHEEEDDDEGQLVVAEEEDEEGVTSGAGTSTTNKERRQEAAELERRRLSHLGALERKFVDGDFDWNDDDDEDWDEEDDSPQQDVPPPPPGTLTYRRFGQENILVERETHTPPTLWMLMCPNVPAPSVSRGEGDEPAETKPSDGNSWPQPDEACRERGCHSAPPVALCSPEHSRTRKKRKAAELKQQLEDLVQQQELKLESPTQQQPPAALTNFITQIRPPTSTTTNATLARLEQQQVQQQA